VAVVLTRYAAQNLYAPLRTVEPVAGIGRVNLRRDLRWTPCCRRCRCTRALAAWRLEDQWVTAVRLTNTSGAGSTSTRARCRATSWRRPSSTNLGPAGTPADTTVVYLVTAATAWPSRCCRRSGPIDAT
jgi:hypothetical protein